MALVAVCAICKVQAQSPPDSLCADVNEDGTVNLSWAIPPGTGPFDNFKIYRDDGAGFQLVNTVGGGQSTYLDGLADASGQPLAYYMTTDNGTESSPSVTVKTIFLSLTSSDLGSVAHLSWNAPYEPMPIGGEYKIERRINPGGFAQVMTLPPTATSAVDTLYALCNDARSVDYRVRYNGLGCDSRSQQTSGEFQDLLGPPVPEVETIGTDPQTGDVTVYWHPVSSPDLEQYVVQDIDIGAQTYIDVGVVPAGDPTEYTYTGASANASTTFGVRAEDECGNEQNFDNTYTTIFTEAFYNDCELTALVAWSPYEGWPEGVEKYVIHAIVDGTDDLVMGEAGPEDLFYSADIEPNTSYCFYVEAVSLGPQRASTSNGACVNTTYPPVPSYFYLGLVSVAQNEFIKVTLIQDPAAEGVVYELYRSEDDSPFRLIGTFDADNNPSMQFADTDVDVRSRVYTYYFKVYDGCGTFLGETNRGNNIVLRATADSSTVTNYLEWTPYEGWQNGVDRYRLMRRLGSEGVLSYYGVLDADLSDYKENVDSYREEQGQFCYRIEAVENNNDFGPGATSISNTVCAVQPPMMWIPNAMVIGGHNDEFKPVAGFIDFDSYGMEIYNKWGIRLYATDDIDEGWKGVYKGNPVREDYYRYTISYRDGSGKPYIAKGAVYVIKQGEP